MMVLISLSSSISSKYQLIFVCLIVINSVVNCIDNVPIPSVDFLPPFTSGEIQNSNNLILPTSTTNRSSNSNNNNISPTKTSINRSTTKAVTVAAATPKTTIIPRSTTTKTARIRTTSSAVLPITTRKSSNIPISSRIQSTAQTAKASPAAAAAPVTVATSSPSQISQIISNRGSPAASLIGSLNQNQAKILKQFQHIEPNGNYEYQFETDNGIQAEERGYLKEVDSISNNGVTTTAEQVIGQYSYTAPNGQLITVTYTADENGFHPQGDHLPTPPPIPDAIIRALRYIAERRQNDN